MVIEKEPLISVIVPVYNVSRYLDKSMETIVSQTYQNLEIILVDDGSTDNSGALCDAWAQKDSRVQVIHQKNAGPSCARNAALDIATGMFVLFSDSDDLLSPDLCRALYDSLLPEADISMCDFVHVFPGKPYSYTIGSELEILEPENVIQRMWYQIDVLPSACAKLYRRSIFADLRFTPGLIFEDIDLLHELFWASRKIVYTHSFLYGYVHRDNSITTSSFSKRDLDILKVTERIRKFSETRPVLQKSAQAYTVTAALRIYLNAPGTPEFRDGISRAEKLIQDHGRAVLKDKNIRNKNRIALWLYFCCKPMLRFAYQHINRWK